MIHPWALATNIWPQRERLSPHFSNAEFGGRFRQTLECPRPLNLSLHINIYTLLRLTICEWLNRHQAADPTADPTADQTKIGPCVHRDHFYRWGVRRVEAYVEFNAQGLRRRGPGWNM
ncbi:hypothetical protein I7I48_00160 [Histoplasma ohiense]|nr:hypothetical protein I7I48_00160 [Histoplasma ohiense (nom. inval.)]